MKDRTMLKMRFALDQAHEDARRWFLSLSHTERKKFIDGMMASMDKVQHKNEDDDIEMRIRVWQYRLMLHSLVCRLTEYDLNSDDSIFKDGGIGA